MQNVIFVIFGVTSLIAHWILVDMGAMAYVETWNWL